MINTLDGTAVPGGALTEHELVPAAIFISTDKRTKAWQVEYTHFGLPDGMVDIRGATICSDIARERHRILSGIATVGHDQSALTSEQYDLPYAMNISPITITPLYTIAATRMAPLSL